jgi:hypothetical protein
MRKRFVQVLVGLTMIVGLVVGPVASGVAGRGAEQADAPDRALAVRTLCGWDDGGSTAS